MDNRKVRKLIMSEVEKNSDQSPCPNIWQQLFQFGYNQKNNGYGKGLSCLVFTFCSFDIVFDIILKSRL